MKATTVAAAAVFLGSVSAEWESWSGSSADSDNSKTPVLDKTTYSKPTEGVKTTIDSSSFSKPTAGKSSDDGSSKTFTGKHSDPAIVTSTAKDSASSTWSAWESDSTPAVKTSKSEDPAHWGEWESSASTPAVKTSKSEDPSTWSEWSASSTPDAKTSTDPNTWGEWESSSTPAVKTSTDPHTWSEWESSTPAVKTSTDPAHTWGEWESSSTPAVVTSKKPEDPSNTWSAWDPTETLTSTSTQWVTVTVYPVDGGKDQTWSEWNSDPATKTNTNTVIVSSTITKTASSAKDSASSWSAWSSAPVAAVDPGCKLEVSVSYGAPVWYPTPVIATDANSTWGEWESATTDPATETYTWWDWEPSSTPDAKTSTDPATWSEWESSSTPAVKTSTDPASSWTAWESASSTSDSAKSTGPAGGNGGWNNGGNNNGNKDGENNNGENNGNKDGGDNKDNGNNGGWNNGENNGNKDNGNNKGGDDNSSKEGGNNNDWNNGNNNGGDNNGNKDSGNNSGNNSGNWSKGNTGISANGNKFGMTYSPYTAGGNCKDQGTVTDDISKIAAKGFTSVRVYSTDCSTLEFVGKAAREHGIKVILGVFISETGISGAQPQVDAIAKWAQWDLVELIVVGNEAVFNNRCSASDLAGFIGSAKSTFQGAGFKGAISTTDELSVWQAQGKAWCDVVDVVSANLYAFFNPNTAAEDAGDFIQRQIDDLSAVCPGKEVYVMESGWPSAGECNGKACPSPENQATAIKGIQSSSGAKVVFFSFEDEQWKKPGQFGVEQHWGCGEVFN